jgi:hypothetical protein
MPGGILIQICSMQKGVRRYPEPIKIELIDFSQMYSKAISEFKFQIIDISINSNINMYLQDNSVFHGNSTMLFVVLPNSESDLSDDIIKRVSVVVAGMYAEAGEPLVTQHLENALKYLYKESASKKIDISIDRNHQPKASITFLRSLPVSEFNSNLLATYLVENLGFNSEALPVKGTVFDLLGKDEHPALPGAIEKRYLRALYQQKSSGNIECIHR